MRGNRWTSSGNTFPDNAMQNNGASSGAGYSSGGASAARAFPSARMHPDERGESLGRLNTVPERDYSYGSGGGGAKPKKKLTPRAPSEGWMLNDSVVNRSAPGLLSTLKNRPGKQTNFKRRSQNARGAEVGSVGANVLRVLDDKGLAKSICDLFVQMYGGYTDNVGGNLEPDEALVIVKSNLRLYAAKHKFGATVYGERREVLSLMVGLNGIRITKEATRREREQFLAQGNEEQAYNKLCEMNYLDVQEEEVLLSIAQKEAFSVSNTTPNYERIDAMLKRIAIELLILEKDTPAKKKKEILDSVDKLIDIAAGLANKGKEDPHVTNKIMDYLAHFKLLHLMFTYETNSTYLFLNLIDLTRLYQALYAVKTSTDRAALYEISIWTCSGVEAAEVRLARVSRYVQQATGIVLKFGQKAKNNVESMVKAKWSYWGVLETALGAVKDAASSLKVWAETDPWHEGENLGERLIEMAQELQHEELSRNAGLLVDAIQESQEVGDYDDSQLFYSQDVDAAVEEAEKSIDESTLDIRNQADELPQTGLEGIEYAEYGRGVPVRENDPLGIIYETESAWLNNQGPYYEESLADMNIPHTERPLINRRWEQDENREQDEY